MKAVNIVLERGINQIMSVFKDLPKGKPTKMSDIKAFGTPITEKKHLFEERCPWHAVFLEVYCTKDKMGSSLDPLLCKV